MFAVLPKNPTKRQKVAFKAIRVLNRDGWTKYALHFKGKHCAVGAWDVACNELGYDSLNEPRSPRGLISFNDRKTTSKRDVIKYIAKRTNLKVKGK